ncbi:type A2 lantipeptide [Streptacidiphilus pinicola]|uniref:Type A2 lantipeptide n=1 Tax=Streptacidiphilus pinicola TaxID=2219663 RepID=A0A2X0IVR6_9ACTN|nr:type A2 lantipeptide [Streptacidiphilus pinicola]RAG87541.1 type A2 lantipeptide [Streptacidiphilus pinicola]
MRSDFTPQVETREIADTDLDGVAGGLGLGAGAGLNGLGGLGVHVNGVGDALTTVGNIVPVGGLVSTVTGLTGLTGTVGNLTSVVSGI